MSPLVTALICFGALLVIGLIAKVAIGTWMKRNELVNPIPDEDPRSPQRMLTNLPHTAARPAPTRT